jgi:hypothetical protein
MTDKIFFNKDMDWECVCGSKDITKHAHEPEREDVYKEVWCNESENVVEKLCSVIVEQALSLECKKCGNSHFEMM